MQALESIASKDGTRLKENGLHVSAHLERTKCLASIGWICKFKRGDIVYRNLSGENRIIDSETIEDWKSYGLLQEIEGCGLCDINNADRF
jgi:hypothetical protein